MAREGRVHENGCGNNPWKDSPCSYISSSPSATCVATPDSAAWTAGCFAVVFAVNAVDGARDIARRPLIELMTARAVERVVLPRV